MGRRHIMLAPQYRLAFQDIIEGVRRWPMWMRLGWTDVRARYRRTTFGPFWATLSLGIFMVSFSIIWSRLWKADLKDYMPFISAGMLSWTMVSAIIVDGTSTFTQQKPLLETMRFPLTVLTCAVVWRNLILFLHNLIVYVVIALIFQVPVGLPILLVPFSLAIISINGIWVATLLGMIGTRYRDVQQLITNILQIMLFLTPIFWKADQLEAAGRTSKLLVDFNPVLHYIDILRDPLLGHWPSAWSWAVVTAGTVVGWLFTFEIYARFRRRITYWL